MSETGLNHLVLIVTGASLRGEAADRPLAYQLAQEVAGRLGPESPWKPLVISDVLYINDKRLAAQPVISVGGPGVNHLSALLYQELPSVMTIDNVLTIQMDIELADLRCCFWGMNHEQTVEALDLLLKRGYLDRFLEGVRQKSQ
ncbi:MAG: hypothetical protein GX616_04490 [Planctomycetes bacterium]|nr:hypothetical protein [Planctomycetota bacterium]